MPAADCAVAVAAEGKCGEKGSGEGGFKVHRVISLVDGRHGPRQSF